MSSEHRYGLDANEGFREMDTNKMDMKNTSHLDEELIIKRQWISLVIAFIFAVVGILLTVYAFGPRQYKYAFLGPCIPMIYLGFSSIKNRLSIVRARGQRGYSRGARAVLMGMLVFLGIAGNIIIIFSPFFDVFPAAK